MPSRGIVDGSSIEVVALIDTVRDLSGGFFEIFEPRAIWGTFGHYLLASYLQVMTYGVRGGCLNEKHVPLWQVREYRNLFISCVQDPYWTLRVGGIGKEVRWNAEDG